MTDHIGKATTMIDLDALEKLADDAGGKSWTLGGGGFVVEGDRPIADFLAQTDPEDWKSAPSLGDAFERAKFVAAANPATIKALIAELKALQAFAADEIAFAFCAGFKDAIDREKWDDCYDFAASKAGDYRNDRIRAFLARNGKGEG